MNSNEFSLGPKLLFSIMPGERTKVIDFFKMYNNPQFGCIAEQDKRKFYKLLSAMKEEKIISIDEDNYGKITVLKENLTDNDYKIIYASMKL